MWVRMYTRQFQILDLSGYKSADVPHPTLVTVVAMNITVVRSCMYLFMKEP